MSDIIDQSLMSKLSLQLTILTVNEKRFSELKFMYDEYHNDNKGTFNNFVINLMHIYRTCIVIDLCKLFIVPNKKDGATDKFKGKSQNSNFYFTINKHKEELNLVYDEVSAILKGLDSAVSLITYERDKELAHKDLSTGITVKMHLNYLKEIEILILCARDILEKLFLTIDAGIHKDTYGNQTLVKIIDFLKDDEVNKQNKIMLEYMNRVNKL